MSTQRFHAMPPSETAARIARVERAIGDGLERLTRLQSDRGSWSADYGGPMFLLPMYVALCHAAGVTIAGERRQRMKEYFLHVQHADGSIGLNVWDSGCMFTTSLSYCALRFLGVPAAAEPLQRMRAWIHHHGTPLAAASWGKFLLAVLNLYDWRGLHPVPAELWLLPYAVPFHPGRLNCHCRQVYLPMAWLYSTRATLPADALTQALRAELYGVPYDTIPFAAHRDHVAPGDNYCPLSPLMRTVNRVLTGYERWAPASLRKRATELVYEHISYEDAVTEGHGLGPVNAVLNTLCHAFHSPGGTAVRRGLGALEAYLWDSGEGLNLQGQISTELWDTAFAVQAYLASPDRDRHRDTLHRAHAFLRDNQITEELPEARAHFRHPVRGGWTFSRRVQAWPVSDCTAEALKCALALEPIDAPSLSPERLRDALRFILSLQNDDGGWGTYERQRGGHWLELLNPAQVFGEIMIDSSSVECTSSCIQALVRVRARFPGEFDRVIDAAVRRAAAYVRGQQRPDGSFEGSWGVCFTYGTWFGVSALLAAGAATSEPAIRRACKFLLAYQKGDGGWGEHHAACRERRYVEHPESQAVMTSWALLTLVRARSHDVRAMQRAVDFLVDRQSHDGAWPREAVAGAFNRTGLINYENYRHYFPVWALAEWIALEEMRAR